MCRASYIDPKVFDRFDDGLTIADVLTQLGDDGRVDDGDDRAAIEAAVIELIADDGDLVKAVAA